MVSSKQRPGGCQRHTRCSRYACQSSEHQSSLHSEPAESSIAGGPLHHESSASTEFAQAATAIPQIQLQRRDVSTFAQVRADQSLRDGRSSDLLSPPRSNGLFGSVLESAQHFKTAGYPEGSGELAVSPFACTITSSAAAYKTILGASFGCLNPFPEHQS